MDSSLSLSKEVRPLGVFPSYLTEQERTIIVFGNVGRGSEDFAFKDEQGGILMKGRPGKSNLLGTKTQIIVKDASGGEMFEVYMQRGWLKKTCTVSTAGTDVMDVRHKYMSDKYSLVFGRIL
ncbi:hypothetical protein IAR50_005730 [Cryptococcus sp. DSM 104548]